MVKWLPRDPTKASQPHYLLHDRTVVVTSCGRLCLYRKKINLSKSLAGQAVGIKEVDHGIWLVIFMDYDLGYIDLEEKTLQPLDNPFGLKCYLCLRYGHGRIWSGRRDSNPRRPAWEIDRRLKIQNLASTGLIADGPRLLISQGPITEAC